MLVTWGWGGLAAAPSFPYDYSKRQGRNQVGGGGREYTI
nr:MAG TPA: hypothetical protein [Caudoviricetes sp.]